MELSYSSGGRMWPAAIGLVALIGLGCSDSSGSAAPGSSAGAAPGAAASGGAGTGGAGSEAGGAPGEPEAPQNDASVCATATFCDDFEAFPAGSPPAGAWRVNQNNASVVVDTSRAFRGAQSVKVSTLGSEETAATYKSGLIGLAGAPVIPLAEGRVYGRMMFYLESAPSESVHWTFIDGTGTVPGQEYSATYRYGGQLPVTEGTTFVGNQLMANYDTTDFYATPSRGPQTDCYAHAQGKVVPVGKWSCAEWFFDGPNNQMRFWLDGAEVTEIAIDGTGEGCVGQAADYTWVAPEFSRIDVGWESYQADGARSIWIDDVVIASSQVGCPAPID